MPRKDRPDSASGPRTPSEAGPKPAPRARRGGHGATDGEGREGGRRESRREELLAAAGELFARQGFEGASMRDVARAVGMLPGSLYYHFASKEEMFLTVHAEVVEDMVRRVGDAVRGAEDPWDRLERASVAHLEGLLEHGNLLAIISPNFTEGRDALNEQVKAHRRRYEVLFRDIVEDIDLPEDARRLLRLQLIGALNWTPVWYREGKAAPADIARSFVRNLRYGAGRGPDDPRG